MWDFLGGSGVNNLPANARDTDTALIPGSERSPGGGNGYPLQNSYLGNSIDRGGGQQSLELQKSQT